VKKHLTSGDDVVYLYEGWQCIEERRLDEDVWTTAREHIYGGQYIDEIVATRESGSLTYYLHDTNYNVIAIADDTGVVQERYWYKPYGSVNFAAPDGTARTEANAVNTTLLFQSRRYDTETGKFGASRRCRCKIAGNLGIEQACIVMWNIPVVSEEIRTCLGEQCTAFRRRRNAIAAVCSAVEGFC